MRSMRWLCVAVVAIGLLFPMSALAAKKYQVTGTVVELKNESNVSTISGEGLIY